MKKLILLTFFAFSANVAIAQDYLHGQSGTTYTDIGGTTFGSDGTSYNRIGDTTFGSDGSSSTE